LIYSLILGGANSVLILVFLPACMTIASPVLLYLINSELRRRKTLI
jgi:hypothetical protein